MKKRQKYFKTFKTREKKLSLEKITQFYSTNQGQHSQILFIRVLRVNILILKNHKILLGPALQNKKIIIYLSPSFIRKIHEDSQMKNIDLSRRNLKTDI